MPRLTPILNDLFDAPSPLSMSDVLLLLPEIAKITEHRRRMPLMNWPWLSDGPADLLHDHKLYDNAADVLHEVRGHIIYSCGNENKLKHMVGSDSPIFFLCRHSDLESSAPDGSVYRTLFDVDGRGVTLMRADMSTEHSKSRVFGASLEGKQGYWEVRADLSVLTALASSEAHKFRLVLSVAISIALVQAVHIARGGSKARCLESVVALSTKPGTDTIGGQIAVLAAVYHKLLQPPRPGESDTPVGTERVFLWDGLPPVDEVVLSSNMYWLAKLGAEENNVGKGAGRRVVGIGNALYFSDPMRPIRWMLASIAIVAVSLVSVVFQHDVHWAEKMEKFLNLLFTVTVATIIGLAGIHPEGNWLYNVTRGKRKIASATDFEAKVFADIVNFLENCDDPGKYVDNEQSCWVSDYNHGTTQLGRPVRLNELAKSKLSVNNRFELCVARKGTAMPRSLDLRRSGIGHIAGAVGTWRDEPNRLFLESRVLVAGVSDWTHAKRTNMNYKYGRARRERR